MIRHQQWELYILRFPEYMYAHVSPQEFEEDLEQYGKMRYVIRNFACQWSCEDC